MKKRPSRIFISLVLIAYLVSGLASAGGAVFCVGDDGHVGLETALNGVCVPGTVVSSEVGIRMWKNQLPSNGRCGPCVDVPTSIGSSARHFRIASQDETPIHQVAAFVAFPADTPACTDIPAKSVFPTPPLAASSHLISLRTVILLS